MRTLIPLICGSFFLVSVAEAQRFGVTAGANFQRLGDISLNALETKFESQNGWHAGVWMEFPSEPFAFRIGGRYLAAGQLFNGLNENFGNVRDNFDVTMAEIFLLIRYGLASPVVSPYVFAGPVFRFPFKTDAVISNDLAPLTYAGEVGGGFQMSLGQLTISPEVAYVFGMTRFVENKLVLEFITLTVGNPQKLNAALLRLSVGL